MSEIFLQVHSLFTKLAIVRSCRGILSLLLLSAYALLLLHDFIPHTHSHHRGDVQAAIVTHHDHHGDHHHSHDHQEKKSEEEKTSEPSEHSGFGDQIIHTHGHSGHDGHQHNLAYRAASKDELNPKIGADQYLIENHWRLPDRFSVSEYYQPGFLPAEANPDLSSGYGLRAPPALRLV